MTEEIAFSDWSKRLEHSNSTNNDLGDESTNVQGTNSWLPAYGFYQPSATLQQTFLQNKNDEFYSNDMVDGNGPPPFFLQTIVEETSDDLRSETSESEYNSGMLTGSVSTVIHVPSYEDNSQFKNMRRSSWNGRRNSEINRDPGVQDDDEEEEEDDFTDEDEDPSTDTQEEDSDEESNHNSPDEAFPSRTSSLLQFENLEKHYETIFRSPKKSSSSNGFDSPFNARNRLWGFKSNSQPENMNSLHDIDDDNDSSSLSSSCSSSSSELVSSDEMMSSYSSTKYGSLSQPRLSLISSRSVDSLTSLQQKQDRELFQSSELSQSLNENISKLNNQNDEIDTAPPQDIYKTMECLSTISKDDYKNDSVLPSGPENTVITGKMKSGKSVENLSEDSGFGDHIIKEPPKVINVKVKEDIDINLFKMPFIEPVSQLIQVESELLTENCPGEFVKPNIVGWQSHEGLLNETFIIENEKTYGNSIDKEEDNSNATLSHLSVASTPNLYTKDEEYSFKTINMVNSTFNEYQNCTSVSLSNIYPPKLIGFENGASQLNGAGPSKGSNIQIMTSFVSVTKPDEKCNREEQHNESEICAPVLENIIVEYPEIQASSTLIYNSSTVPCKNKIEYSPINNVNAQLSKSSSWIYYNEDEEDFDEQFQSKELKSITSSPIGKSLPEVASHVQESNVSPDLNKISPDTQKLATVENNVTPNNLESFVISNKNKEKTKSSLGKLGGFFHRFSLKRLSGKRHKNKLNSSSLPIHGSDHQNSCENEDEKQQTPISRDIIVVGKPPLHPNPPCYLRSPPESPALEDEQICKNVNDVNSSVSLDNTSFNTIDSRLGLLETDLDANSSLPCPPNSNDDGISNSVTNKKSKSLLNLDNGRMSIKQSVPEDEIESNGCKDYRAKSMEFLLDKENQASIKAPENELQKGNGERKMSEHELRIQKSLQKLNIPEWYKNSMVPSQGFLLKRHNENGQNSQVQSKNTSFSNLCSKLYTTKSSGHSANNSTTSQYSFSRWSTSTSKLNSANSSSFTSPSGSARSSFNCKQPYLGWRSQEKLSKPRTPAERLAAGLSPQISLNGNETRNGTDLEDIQSSIKEVTSAIVHYVSGTSDSSDRSPSLKQSKDSTFSSKLLHGSASKLCWLESSFVGSRLHNSTGNDLLFDCPLPGKGLSIYKNPCDFEAGEYILA